MELMGWRQFGIGQEKPRLRDELRARLLARSGGGGELRKTQRLGQDDIIIQVAEEKMQLEQFGTHGPHSVRSPYQPAAALPTRCVRLIASERKAVLVARNVIALDQQIGCKSRAEKRHDRHRQAGKAACRFLRWTRPYAPSSIGKRGDHGSQGHRCKPTNVATTKAEDATGLANHSAEDDGIAHQSSQLGSIVMGDED